MNEREFAEFVLGKVPYITFGATLLSSGILLMILGEMRPVMVQETQHYLEENVASEESPRLTPPVFPGARDYVLRALTTAGIMALAGALFGLTLKVFHIGFDFGFDRLK